MNKYRKNIRVLIIDRGWLENQTIYEEYFLSFLDLELTKLERKVNQKSPSGISIRLETISIMNEINNDKVFDFVDEKEKVKELKYEYYRKLEMEFPDYTARYSSDRIKNSSSRLLSKKLHVFIVYTESDKEIEVLSKKYSCKAILKFNKETNQFDDDYRRIYINSMKLALKIAKEMPLFLFQDIKELQPYII